jgi:hypothetical protein
MAKHIGSCMYCGTFIVHHFVIQDANGHQFFVGSECVNKTGDASLVDGVKAFKKAAEKEERAAKKAEAARIKKEAKDAQLEALKAEWIQSTPRGQEIIDFLTDQVKKADTPYFYTSLLQQFNRCGLLTENQANAAIRAIDAMVAAATKKPSEYVGKIGQRLSLDVTVTKKISIQTDSWSYYDSGVMDIYTLTDKDGNIFTIFTKSRFSDINQGDHVTLKATVKEHKEYKGEKQTVINRPKWG